MNKSRSAMLIAAAITLCAFISIVYVSCGKAGKDPLCFNHACSNNGYCAKGHCYCAAGYEDSFCKTPVVNKFLGYWTTMQKISGSSIRSAIGTDSTYQLLIDTSSVPTAIFLNNFLGNPDYIKIVGVVDTLHTSTFHIQKYTPVFSNPNNYTLDSGMATVYGDTLISGTYYAHYINSSGFYEMDTVSLHLVPCQSCK